MFCRIVGRGLAANATAGSRIAAPTTRIAAQGARRRFAGHHKTVPGQLHVPHVEGWHKAFGEYGMMTMWLWIMYRCKEDGAIVFGLESHFDESHDDHGHDDHGHGHHEEIDREAIDKILAGVGHYNNKHGQEKKWVKKLGNVAPARAEDE